MMVVLVHGTMVAKRKIGYMMQGLLPRKLRLLRAERQLSLRQAAKLTGLAKETLSDLERGRRHPNDVTLAKVAEGYGISVEELFDLEEEHQAEEKPVLLGKAEAPRESGRPDREVSAADLAREAALNQGKQDQQAANRALSSERQPQSGFARHENEVMPRLLECYPDELAGALFESEKRNVQQEQRIVQQEQRIVQQEQRIVELEREIAQTQQAGASRRGAREAERAGS
jgi:transcriptional regulator with XRE-family HTH domain